MKFALITLLATASFAAQAEFKTGNKLYQQITGNHGEYMNAIGYVTGVADALNGAIACPPESVTAGQLMDMTKLYLENYPSTRHLSADAIISRIMSVTWPCKKGPSL